MQEFFQQHYQHLTTSNHNPFVQLHLWSQITLQILQDRSMKFISILRFEHTHTISPRILQKPCSGTCWFQCGCETRWNCNVKLNKVQTTPIGSTYQIYYLPFGWFPICVHVLEKNHAQYFATTSLGILSHQKNKWHETLSSINRCFQVLVKGGRY